MNAAFLLLGMQQNYTVKRSSGSGGQTGAPTNFITGLTGTRLLPASRETLSRLKLETPLDVREVYLSGLFPTIRVGMWLNDGTRDYLIKHSELWPHWNATAHTLVVVEEAQR